MTKFSFLIMVAATLAICCSGRLQPIGGFSLPGSLQLSTRAVKLEQNNGWPDPFFAQAGRNGDYFVAVCSNTADADATDALFLRRHDGKSNATIPLSVSGGNMRGDITLYRVHRSIVNIVYKSGVCELVEIAPPVSAPTSSFRSRCSLPVEASLDGKGGNWELASVDMTDKRVLLTVSQGTTNTTCTSEFVDSGYDTCIELTLRFWNIDIVMGGYGNNDTVPISAASQTVQLKVPPLSSGDSMNIQKLDNFGFVLGWGAFAQVLLVASRSFKPLVLNVGKGLQLNNVLIGQDSLVIQSTHEEGGVELQSFERPAAASPQAPREIWHLTFPYRWASEFQKQSTFIHDSTVIGHLIMATTAVSQDVGYELHAIDWATGDIVWEFPQYFAMQFIGFLDVRVEDSPVAAFRSQGTETSLILLNAKGKQINTKIHTSDFYVSQGTVFTYDGNLIAGITLISVHTATLPPRSPGSSFAIAPDNDSNIWAAWGNTVQGWTIRDTSTELCWTDGTSTINLRSSIDDSVVFIAKRGYLQQCSYTSYLTDADFAQNMARCFPGGVAQLSSLSWNPSRGTNTSAQFPVWFNGTAVTLTSATCSSLGPMLKREFSQCAAVRGSADTAGPSEDSKLARALSWVEKVSKSYVQVTTTRSGLQQEFFELGTPFKIQELFGALNSWELDETPSACDFDATACTVLPAKLLVTNKTINSTNAAVCNPVRQYVAQYFWCFAGRNWLLADVGKSYFELQINQFFGPRIGLDLTVKCEVGDFVNRLYSEAISFRSNGTDIQLVVDVMGFPFLLTQWKGDGKAPGAPGMSHHGLVAQLTPCNQGYHGYHLTPWIILFGVLLGFGLFTMFLQFLFHCAPVRRCWAYIVVTIVSKCTGQNFQRGFAARWQGAYGKGKLLNGIRRYVVNREDVSRDLTDAIASRIIFEVLRRRHGVVYKEVKPNPSEQKPVQKSDRQSYMGVRGGYSESQAQIELSGAHNPNPTDSFERKNYYDQIDLMVAKNQTVRAEMQVMETFFCTSFTEHLTRLPIVFPASPDELKELACTEEDDRKALRKNIDAVYDLFEEVLDIDYCYLYDHFNTVRPLPKRERPQDEEDNFLSTIRPGSKADETSDVKEAPPISEVVSQSTSPAALTDSASRRSSSLQSAPSPQSPPPGSSSSEVREEEPNPEALAAENDNEEDCGENDGSKDAFSSNASLNAKADENEPPVTNAPSAAPPAANPRSVIARSQPSLHTATQETPLLSAAPTHIDDATAVCVDRGQTEANGSGEDSDPKRKVIGLKSKVKEWFAPKEQDPQATIDKREELAKKLLEIRFDEGKTPTTVQNIEIFVAKGKALTWFAVFELVVQLLYLGLFRTFQLCDTCDSGVRFVLLMFMLSDTFVANGLIVPVIVEATAVCYKRPKNVAHIVISILVPSNLIVLGGLIWGSYVVSLFCIVVILVLISVLRKMVFLAIIPRHLRIKKLEKSRYNWWCICVNKITPKGHARQRLFLGLIRLVLYTVFAFLYHYSAASYVWQMGSSNPLHTKTTFGWYPVNQKLFFHDFNSRLNACFDDYNSNVFAML